MKKWFFSLGTLWLFGWSLARHAAYQSGAFDLGIFDQALWLLAKGLTPHSTLMGFHILGDHAAFILYPLSLVYRLFPHVEAMLFLQALALASAVIPLLLLAETRVSWGWAIALAYLLTPGMVNAAIYDFHPEVFAVPALFWALLCLERRKLAGFFVCLLLVFACKEVLSLSVLFLGIALLLKRRWTEGALAVGLGLGWAIFSTQWVIPHFSGASVAAIGRYGNLGHGPAEILKNLVLHPQLLLTHLFSLPSLGYDLALILPIAGGLALWAFRDPIVLLPILPPYLLNILSEAVTQRGLLHQYALSMLPFLFYGAIQASSNSRGKPVRWITWAIIGFLSLGAWRFTPQWMASGQSIPKLERAMSLIPESASVATNHQIVPHLSHRKEIDFFRDQKLPGSWEVDAILVDLAQPGWNTTASKLREATHRLPSLGYEKAFQEGEIQLFRKASSPEKKRGR